jgi:hypothetical protein
MSLGLMGCTIDTSFSDITVQVAECIMAHSILEAAWRADEFFIDASPIHQAISRLAKTLGEMRIPFAVAGAMAANAHGHRRTTADVDILLRRDDLARFKQQHIGRGWVDKFENPKNFRDAVCDVNIVVLLVGDFPGDGRLKPVAFPAPEAVAEVGSDGIPYVSLPALLELKLASGMTAPHRFQDLADVVALIRVNQLPATFADQFNPYVADKYRELWGLAQIESEY